MSATSGSANRSKIAGLRANALAGPIMLLIE